MFGTESAALPPDGDAAVGASACGVARTANGRPRPARAAQQLAERRKLVPPPTIEEPIPTAPGELAPAVIVELLLDIIRHPDHDAQAVSHHFVRLGHRVTPEQVENIFRRHDLKKLCAPAGGDRGLEIFTDLLIARGCVKLMRHRVRGRAPAAEERRA